MSETVILSIDCGTQSLRSMLFDEKGNLLCIAKKEYAPYFSEKPGWAEQDPEVFWSALCETCNTLKQEKPDLFSGIAGVGITTQRDTMVNVDHDGRAMRPAITWLDQRKARPVYKPPQFLEIAFKSVGMSEAVQKTQMDGKCNWIRQNQPDIWRNTHKYIQVSGFLNFKLTGEFNDSIASQIGHIPFDYRKMKWAGKKHLNAKVFPVEREKLPGLVPPGAHIGRITSVASCATGISEGIPVIACGSDKGCETIGMGVVNQKMASLSFGTTATVQTTSGRYFEPLKFMPAYPAPIPGMFNPEVEIFRGYWMITWFRNEFAQKEMEEAARKGIVPEKVMDELLSEVPAGAMGLMVQPYWSPGLKTPSAKGSMIGFGDVHGKAHVYRAVIEGLAYALLDGLHSMEKSGGRKFDSLAVSGGASQSDQICQISADIFNLPLVKGKTHETSGLGAAIVTAVGLGVYGSYDMAIKEMVSYDRVFEPRKENVDIYSGLYERVYKRMYAALEPLYREIRDITGYPEKP